MRTRFDPEIHHRRSIRLKGYDYSQAGAYFVTVVTPQRACLFGQVNEGAMALNEAGRIVEEEWENLARRFEYVDLGAFIVMPNHFHGVVILQPPVGATRPLRAPPSSSYAALPSRGGNSAEGSPLHCGPQSHSLGAIIAQFKSRVTKRIRRIRHTPGLPVWQRNYYEHIIRNERQMEKIWLYVQCNASTWAEDDENPARIAALAV